ncbi:ABC transporter ATP-binding protein [Falsirhodobacter sp. alg1]|uniref:ABC transporter ATP-binding protein n=1 Tax=Falsirhodobacter sp. alg1 TaxID=1472418 RepID=UPI0005EEF4B2|nr:ABC transporter ATP-binding protein [Falsirhodobacter sp. alg1]
MADVHLKRVRKSYGNVMALSEINIEIPTGTFFTLLGPSGCGKTTLLRAIAGFHTHDSGEIVVNGTDIGKLPAHRRNVGMVFQDYAIFPHVTVRENVAFGLKERKVPRAEITRRVDDILEKVQLAAYADRMPHALSGGQQQRVGLARALVVQPTLLLMDEPLSNLDAKLRVDLRRELRAVQQSMDMTTVYVTHDQEEALAMSDTVCVMYGGVIQQAAAPWEIYHSPANRFVAAFVGSNNFIPLVNGTIAGVPVPLAPGIPGNGAELALRPENLQIVTGTPPEGMVTLPATLDQVAFTGREVSVALHLENGQEVQAICAPDPALLGLPRGARTQLAFDPSRAQVFESGVTGRRLS